MAVCQEQLPTLSLSVDNGSTVDKKQPFLKCRHMVTFVGFLSFFIGTGFRVNSSVSMVAMVNHSAVAQRSKVMSDSCPVFMSNSTQTDTARDGNENGEFLWSPEVQGYILGSQFFPFLFAQIPAGRIVDTRGAKWFLFLSIFITSVATLLIPVLSWISAVAMIVLQLIRGLAQSFLWPATSVLVTKWFPRSERGQMFSVVLSGSPLGCCLCSLLSGILCASSARWPSSFYVVGGIGLFVSIMIVFCLHESPAVHPRISKAELNFILENQEAKEKIKRPSPPWREMCKSVPLYALFYSSLGIGWGYAQFVSVHTIFLGTILHYPIAKNGLFIALTFLFKFVCINIATCLSSVMIKKKIGSMTFVRKFWTLVSALGFSASLLGICLVGCNRSLSVVFGVLSIGFTGVSFAGSAVSVPDMSPNFAGFLQGINSAVTLSPSFFLPLLMGFMTDGKQTIEQWNKVFYIGIAIVLSSGILYSLFGSADIQPWNSVKEDNKEEKT